MIAIKKMIAALAAATLLFVPAQAQTTALHEIDLLDAARKNNPSLKAASAAAEAEKILARTGNSLSDPEINYIYQWGRTEGAFQDEFTATQNFDFPTAYGQRSRMAQAKEKIAGATFDARQIEVLTEVKLLVQEVIYLQKKERTDSLRLLDARKNRELAEISFQKGDMTAFDKNNTELTAFFAQNNLLNTQMALASVASALRLATGLEISNHTRIEPLPLPELPPLERLLENAFAYDPELLAAEVAGQSALIERRLATSLALPKFSLGYKYSSGGGEKFNGIITGISLPLFESRHTVQLAKARQMEADASYAALRLGRIEELTAKYQQVQQMKSIVALSSQAADTGGNTELLKKALDMGTISVHEYLAAIDVLYAGHDQRNEIVYTYNKLVIELLKYAF